MVLGRFHQWWYVDRKDAELGEYSTWSGTYPVYWYYDENADTIGGKIPAGPIMLNRSRFDDLSSDTSKYILEHEVGHQLRSFITYGFIAVILAIVYIALIAIRQLIGTNLAEFLIYLGVGLILAILAFVVSRNWEEMMAELHALNESSVGIFLEAHREVAEQRSKNFKTRAEKRILYPKPETVVLFHRLLDHGVVRFLIR